MKAMRQQKSWMALLALLFIFAACKGESPTAPPPGGGPGPTPTPTGINVTLTASNASPVVDSIVVVTATVTSNGTPVPDGTAVEFSATGGSFSPTETVTSILRTTTNGVATVELRSTVAGPITVQATVGNVIRTVSVTYRVTPTIPPPTSTAPTITSITPAIGVPTGGERIRIIGRNFKEPVRVLFDLGGAQPVEAFVTSVSETEIEVLTPGVNLGAGQQLIADVIVITQAGSVNEQRASLADAFTFRNEQLTPRISTASPNSGPVTGGTRVSIFGDGFQAPVQVLFGSAEARVVTVEYGLIIVESPAGRDTTDDGSGTVTGSVPITVRNINSQTSTVMDAGFRYVANMQITAAGPTEGIYTGGTKVEIEGIGFVAPVAVTIGGVAAQPISVTGSKVIAITSGVTLTGCSDITGPITVTNIVNGDTASGPDFTYRVPRPIIVNVIVTNDPPPQLPGADPGESVGILVANALPGVNRIRVGDRTVFISGQTFNPDGTALFTVTLPANFTFPTEACTVDGVAGVRTLPIDLDVTYENVQSGCTDTAEQSLTVTPPSNECVLPPPQNAVITPITPPCASMGNVVAAGVVNGTTTFTITNTGGRPLIISNVSVIESNNTTTVTVAPTSGTVAPQGSQTFTVTADPLAAGGFDGRIRVNTNDPDTPQLEFCFNGTGT